MTQTNAREDTAVPYALRQQFGFKLSRTSRLMQQRLEAALAPEGMSRLTWCVLSSIGLEGITTPSGIADNLGVTRPMLSRLVKTLTEMDLIQSSLDVDDGRTRNLSLTKKGREKLKTCRPLVQANNAYFSQKLTVGQLRELHEILDALLLGEEPYLDTL